MLRCLLKTSLDGLLVLQGAKISHFNSRILEIWHPPLTVIEPRNDSDLMNYQKSLLLNADEFAKDIEDEYRHPDKNRETLIRFKDGRRFVRTSTPYKQEKKVVGRVVSYRLA